MNYTHIQQNYTLSFADHRYGHESFAGTYVVPFCFFYLKIYHKNPICERVLTNSWKFPHKVFTIDFYIIGSKQPKRQKLTRRTREGSI